MHNTMNEKVFMNQFFNSTEVHAVLSGLPKELRQNIFTNYFQREKTFFGFWF